MVSIVNEGVLKVWLSTVNIRCTLIGPPEMLNKQVPDNTVHVYLTEV